jgi:hypothetical protein
LDNPESSFLLITATAILGIQSSGYNLQGQVYATIISGM